MKNVKKLSAIVLALLMLMTLAIPATAAETYTITINNSNPDHTYGAYQVFSGSISDEVLVDIEWGASITDPDALLAALKEMSELDFSSATTAVEVASVLKAEGVEAYSDQMNAFAKVVGQYLVSNSVAAYSTSTQGSDNYTIEVSNAGYYLVKDEVALENVDSATMYMLDVAKDITMTPKSDVPTVMKKVLEDTDVVDMTGANFAADANYNDVADWDMNEVKQFKLYGTIPANFDELKAYETYKFAFHDSYDAGITVEDDIATTYTAAYRVNGVETELNSDSFEVVLDSTAREITFTSKDLKTLLGDDIYKNPVIVITYNALLNESSPIGLPGNINDVYLEFSNDPYKSAAEGTFGGDKHETGETEEDFAIVFTYGLDSTKKDADTNAVLSDAKFKLRNSNNEWASLDANFNLLEWTTEDLATEISSNDSGKFFIKGLDADTYYLKETQAPAGYNKLTKEIELVITSTKDEAGIYTQDWTSKVPTDALTTINLAVDGAKVTPTTNASPTFEVLNSKGATLPETGGIGTTIFYVVGGLLVLGAVVLLITKKRMASKG